MGYPLDSPLAKALGLCFATLAAAPIVLKEAWGIQLSGSFGGGTVGTALGIVAVVIVGLLMITTDNAFEE